MKTLVPLSLLILIPGSSLVPALVMEASAQTTAPRSNDTPLEVRSARQRLDECLMRLEETAGGPVAASLTPYHELLDLLRSTPGLIESVPAVLQAGAGSLDGSDALIRGLEEIGTGAAQEALLAIPSDGSLRHTDRLRAIIALGGVESPTEAAFAGLWALAGQRSDPASLDLSNTALLALGSAGSRLVDAPERRAAVRSGLVDRLRATEDVGERTMLLKAIGNLRDVTLGGLVVESLFDESAPVRAAAAWTLGALQDVANRDTLAMQLPAEPRGAVRAAMAEALLRLPPSDLALQAVNGLTRNERNHQARAMMVRYLVKHLHAFEEARPTLLERVATDPTPQVRLLASYVLRH
jgi:hypothetical protein